MGIEYDIVDTEVEGVETLFLPSGGDAVAKAATNGVQEAPRLDSPLRVLGGARARPWRRRTPRRQRLADGSEHASRGSGGKGR